MLADDDVGEDERRGGGRQEQPAQDRMDLPAGSGPPEAPPTLETGCRRSRYQARNTAMASRHASRPSRRSPPGPSLDEVHGLSLYRAARWRRGPYGARPCPSRAGASPLPFPGVSLPDHEPLIRQAEAAGYDDLWSGEATGAIDGFTPLVLAAAWTERLRLGTGVVNPYTRGITVLAQHAAALQDASGGRFVLGLGASSDVIVERWNGIPFVKPLSRGPGGRPGAAGGSGGRARGPAAFASTRRPPARRPI